MENINPDWQNQKIDTTQNPRTQYFQAVTTLQSYLTHWHDLGKDLKFYIPSPTFSKERQAEVIKHFQEEFDPNFIIKDLLNPQSTTRSYDVNQNVNSPLQKAYHIENTERRSALRDDQNYIRIINLLTHPFGHIDSPIEIVRPNGNTLRSNFLMDICMLYNYQEGLNQEEILIVRTLMKSRINLVMREDFRPEKIIEDRQNNPELYITRMREMMFFVFCFDFVADLIDCNHSKVLVTRLKDKVKSVLQTVKFSPLEIEDFDLNPFLTSIFKSAMEIGGYTQPMRQSIHRSIVKMSTNPKYARFCEILIQNQANPQDSNHISRDLMPEIREEFVKILSSYCQNLPDQVFRPSIDQLDKIIKICRTSYVYGHENSELGLTEELLLARAPIEESKKYYTSVLTGGKNNSNIYAINDNRGELSGFITIKEVEPQTAEVVNMFIDPDKTAKGLGSQLINQVLSRFSKLKITVQVATHNQKAINFYKKNGFITTKPEFKTIEMGGDKVMSVDQMEIPQNLTERLNNWLIHTGIKLLNELVIRIANQVYK